MWVNMGGEAGFETGVEIALGGEGNKGEGDEQLAVWLVEAPRAVIGDSRKPTGARYSSELISATEVDDSTGFETKTGALSGRSAT